MLILIVEDDSDVAETYVDALESAGYTCEHVLDGAAATESLATKTYDLILLDIELPEKSGLDLLHEIRGKSSLQPVLIITGRGDLTDRIEGLDLGADDYLVKPIELLEMLARVRSILRRASGGESLNLIVGDLSVDLGNRHVIRGEREIELTNRQFDFLARHVNHTVTYEQLARDVWKHSEKAAPINNLLAAHVSHLREKLNEGDAPNLIHTVWGQGFCLKPSDEEDTA